MYDPTGNHPIVPYVSLCSGYEGIGLGLHRCIPNLRTVAYCEREIFGAANLCAKIEAGLLDPAPIFTDVCTFPWSEFAPVMAQGILSFGWPCQPVSHAGKRKATEDERWLFDIIADGIGVMRPGWLFAENVEGLLSARMPDGSSVFGHCITRLERLHYKVAAGIFSAAEVGAPHQRKRVFILAYRHGERGQLPDWWRVAAEQVPVGYGETWRDGRELVNAELHGRQDWQHDNSGPQLSGRHSVAWPSRPGEPQHEWEPPRVVVDAKSQQAGQRSELRSEECGSRGALSWDIEQPSEAAAANNHSAHAGHGEQRPERTLGDLSGGCGEAMGQPSSQRCKQAERAVRGEQQPSGIGEECGLGVAEAVGNAARLPAGGTRSEQNQSPEQRRRRSGHADSESATQHDSQTQPPLGRDADGPAGGLGYAELYTTCDNRTDELRLLGNGVVPATAERAFRVLVGEPMEHANL